MREAPLPPVTTRWDQPGRSATGTAHSGIPLAPPFVPGAPQMQPEEPMPVLRSFDSVPVEEEAAAPAAAPIQQQLRDPSEPLMPWEETPTEWTPPASHEAPATAGPAVTSEAEGSTDSSTPRDLDDWESAIDSDGGQAVPAYGDEESAEDAAFSPPPLLDDEGAVMQQPETADQSFPLDAFIIPPDAKRLPKGLEHAEELHLEVAEALAKRLESVAQRLRREGFAGLLHHEPGQEPIDTLIAGVLAGYLSNQADA